MVAKDGRTLEFASTQLKANLAVALNAVMENDMALKLDSSEL